MRPNDSSTVCVSSGAIVRRSITSTDTPWVARSSATWRQSWTIRETLTKVTSLPGRAMRALPMGSR